MAALSALAIKNRQIIYFSFRSISTKCIKDLHWKQPILVWNQNCSYDVINKLAVASATGNQHLNTLVHFAEMH